MDSRERLVDSAQRLFWRHGYSTTSPREVMADSGIGQGSYYHHFGTKAELGRAAIAANGRDLLTAINAATERLKTGRERVLAFLASAGSALDGCRIGGFAYDAGVLAEPELRTALAAAFADLIDVVEGFVRDGQQDASLAARLDARATAAALVALVEGAFVTARATGQQAAADDVIAGARAFVDAL